MATESPRPGFLGNITQDQEAKLQKLWNILLKASDATSDKEATNGSAAEPTSPAQSQPARRGSLLSRTQSNVSDQTVPTPSSPYQKKIMASLTELGIAAPESRMIQKSLSEITPKELRTGVLDTLKHDHPDAMLLRFLRARKWDVCKAFAMMMEAIVWRVKEMHVDDEVMANGELYALKQSKNNGDVAKQKEGKDFLAQMRMGKSFIHGHDNIGRPIVVIRVQLHKPGAQSEETLERYIVHVIESVRLTLRGSVETAAVVFDMSGFGLSNMEYPPVKFILKCFEANYPESLGILLIHKAPWVFSGIWRLIRGWMDPDIAAKVNFTNSVDDLAKYIPRNQIVKELGGDEDWTYNYIEPEEQENKTMEDTTTRDALLREREQIGEELLSATAEWIEASKSKDKSKIQAAESQRAYQVERLRVNYWKVDPYVRARVYLDRVGVIQGEGNVDFYPKNKPAQESGKASDVEHLEKVNGNGAQTAAA